MKTLLEHNEKMFKETDKWFKRDIEKEDKYAGVLCGECGEVVFYSGPWGHNGGPFFRREVTCPNCGMQGIKTIRMWELETLKYRNVALEGK